MCGWVGVDDAWAFVFVLFIRLTLLSASPRILAASRDLQLTLELIRVNHSHGSLSLGLAFVMFRFGSAGFTTR